ncbi:MAG: DUF1854 domain-containing protein [Defluviitaleaceae bacterium]|nr:DUF1854 domain-containing protein [Defluviitaleaceae bacterium]
MDTETQIGLMDTNKAEFYVTEGGFAGLRYEGEDYPHIVLRRSLPIKEPMKYISVADHENKEIGIIRSVEDLNGAQRDIIINELDNRYYAPHVLEILSVKDKLGYVYIEMRIQNKSGKEHNKNCAIKDVNRNIRMLSDTSLIIFDVDGNRYIIEDLGKLDKHSIKRLDPYLF